MKKRIPKAVRFIKRHGWIEVTSERTTILTPHLMIFNAPEDFKIGIDDFGDGVYLEEGKYEYSEVKKEFIKVTTIPNYQKVVDGLIKNRQGYNEAEIVKEYGMIKLLEWKPKVYLVELETRNASAYIRYDIYQYLTKGFYQVDKWEVYTGKNTVMGYISNLENPLFTLVMPVDLKE